MSKEEIVSNAMAAIAAGQEQVLKDAIGAAVDASALEQKASDGTMTQADVDAAVAQVVGPLNDQIASLQAQVGVDAQVLADAQAKAASDLAAVQQALADMTAKEQMEEQAVADVKSKIDSVQASFDAIRAILAPPQQ